MMTLRELREQLSDNQIKDILSQFDVFPTFENAGWIIFPTCCHNLTGGSPKLYYYKNTKLFKCYTQCGDMFDIFALLIRMYELRGKIITINQAISLCDLDNSNINFDPEIGQALEDLKYLRELNSAAIIAKEEIKLKIYDKNIINRFTFNLQGVQSWIQEGISLNEITRFNIRYDSVKNCIIIPNYDYDGNLIGVRGRFLNEDAIAKYAPIWHNNVCLSHPTGRSLYGIYENKKYIEKKKMVIIFEGEKSVLRYGTYYDNNIAVATLGQNITREHISLLLKMGVCNVILAYDVDYETYDQLRDKEKEYKQLASILAPYFNISILIDYDLELEYKMSPVDGGKQIFERLLRERVNVTQ